MRNLFSRLLLVVFLSVCLLGAGCFTTKFTLIPPDKAKVDLAYVGNWNADSFSAEGREAGLIIRNIDDKLYYVEWKPKDSSVVRTTGFITDVKGATFAQVRGMETDGKLSDEWLIVRLELKDQKLTIRQLSEKFFKAKTIESAEQLRTLIESNLDNVEMYDAGTTVATRAPQ